MPLSFRLEWHKNPTIHLAVFKEANLYTTNFRGADLIRADFQGARASPGSVQDLGGAAPENLQTPGKLPTALELSLIAFVGADMNTWRLTGWARTPMAVEALLGVILLAVILIGFSRKVIRD